MSKNLRYSVDDLVLINFGCEGAKPELARIIKRYPDNEMIDYKFRLLDILNVEYAGVESIIIDRYMSERGIVG